jgi:hypothetical protein
MATTTMTTMTTARRNRRMAREALAFLRQEGILLDDVHLALDVDKKIDASDKLTHVEAEILWLGITQAQVQLIKENLI